MGPCCPAHPWPPAWTPGAGLHAAPDARGIEELDEALVKLTEDDGQVFTNELLRLIPHPGTRPCWPRVLISCRTHYFRTLSDQQTRFTGEERGPHDAAAYRAMVLLPLTEDQVRRYLGAALAERTGPPATDADPALERLFEAIDAVRNLTELIRRPLTMCIVSDFIPELE